MSDKNNRVGYTFYGTDGFMARYLYNSIEP